MTRPSLLRLACLAAALPALFAAASATPLTLEIRDFVELPITGKLDGKGQTDGMLARVNGLREEPGGANRLFVHDLNGPLYILDKASKKLSVYLDFNGREGKPGLFHRFAYETGYANGLVSVQFDPDYRRNGRFYTVHIEDPSVDAPLVPDPANTPGLNVRGYEPTKAISHAGRDPARRRADRVDRYQHRQHDVRGIRARADARPAQHAHPPAGRSRFQPGGAGRRRGLARALCRLR
jgi:hypothetical protein